MKTKIQFVITAIILAFSFQVQAINATYRDQLIKSGCTQVTEANGTCDIHKTRAQNEDRFATDPVIKERREVAAFIEDSVLGASVQQGTRALLDNGYKNIGVDKWKKGKTVIILSRANGVFSTSVLK